MTRLTSHMIDGVDETIASYDRELVRKTGLTLKQIAVRTAGISDRDLDRTLHSECAAVIPITAGQGVIHGFTRAVHVIVRHLGCPSFITDNSDAAGLAEGIERGATVVFLADDSRFVAVNLSLKRVVDNAVATGWSYAHALDACAGGLKGRDVLLIGAGKVGQHAVAALDRLGAHIGVFDIDESKIRKLTGRFPIKEEKNLRVALDRYSLFYDASPAPGIILPEHIKPDTVVAACGIPIGLSNDARDLVSARLIHDPLQMGTAAMLAMAVCRDWNNNNGGQIGRIA